MSIFKITLLIYLFLSVLGLRCCVGFSLVAVLGLLIAVASLLQSTASRSMGFSGCTSQALEHRLGSCGALAQLFYGSGIRPMSPSLAGGFFTLSHKGSPRMAVLEVRGK